MRCTVRVKTPLRETFVFPGKTGFFGPPTGAEPTAFWDQTPFNTLKNQGYHLEHNYGHGEQNLSVVLALLMMLAFLVDQVQQLCCPLFQAAWHKMKTKCHLWEELRHHFRLLLFGSMAELLTALIRGIAPQNPIFGDTS